MSCFSEEERIRFLKERVREGNADCMMDLGALLMEKDPAEARNLFRRAGKKGVKEGCWAAGFCFMLGVGGERNTERMWEWFEKGSHASESSGITTECINCDFVPCSLHFNGLFFPFLPLLPSFIEQSFQNTPFQTTINILYSLLSFHHSTASKLNNDRILWLRDALSFCSTISSLSFTSSFHFISLLGLSFRHLFLVFSLPDSSNPLVNISPILTSLTMFSSLTSLELNVISFPFVWTLTMTMTMGLFHLERNGFQDDSLEEFGSVLLSNSSFTRLSLRFT